MTPAHEGPSVSIRNFTDNKHVREVFIFIAVVLGGFFLPQWLWGWTIPSHQIAYGVIIGSLTALTSFGLALVYRANKVINFAQADLGAVPASLAVGLVTVSMWSFWIAVPLALIASVALGSFVEFTVIRRFSKAPRLILMVVTIGLAQLLAGLGVAIPFWLGAELPPQQLPVPFDFSYDFKGYIFHANSLLAIITTVVAIFFLFVFLRFTSIGIALRASSESADRAGLLGVNVGFTHNVAWVIATLMASITLIMRASILGLPLGSSLGPSILLRALTAAVIGRMERFGVMFLAACGLGVVEVMIIWNKSSSALVDPVMFVIVIGVLLLQRRSKESRVEDQAISSWQNAANVRPIPRELISLPEVQVGAARVASAVRGRAHRVAVHARTAATRTWPPPSRSTRSSPSRSCCSPAGPVRSAWGRSRSSPSARQRRAPRTCTGNSIPP